jgi:integrase/recombinase XerD
MTAARELRPPARATMFETLIGLLACTGLRIGEALQLNRDDFVPLSPLVGPQVEDV